MLVYDVMDEDSYQETKKDYREFVEFNGPDIPVILVGNNCESENHSVSKDEVDQFAFSNGIAHVHASSNDGTNIEYIFTSLAEKMLAIRKSQP